MDRGIGSSYKSKSGRSLSRQNYGQLGSNSLLLRPDVSRIDKNFFAPDQLTNDPNPILPQKYNKSLLLQTKF